MQLREFERNKCVQVKPSWYKRAQGIANLVERPGYGVERTKEETAK
jgi:hypothetical protein